MSQPSENIRITGDDLPHKVLERALKVLAPLENPADFVFRIAGRREYIVGDCPMRRFDYVTSCLKNNKPVELEIVRKAESEIDAGDREDELIDEKLVQVMIGIITNSTVSWKN